MSAKPPLTPATLAACVAIAACAFAAAPIDAGAGRVLLQLTPAQDFTPADGRPMQVPAWRINEAIAQRVIAAFNAQQPPVIDYEHQTLHKETNGQPAPAAGWIHGLRWLEGRGLFAEAELTARARQLIEAGEYRYFSPVFEYSPASGEIARILMGALTNHPAIAGMQALDAAQAAASARFGPSSAPNTTTPSTKESDMDLLKKLLAALGLPEDASEEQALDALKALTDKAAPPAVAATSATTTPDPAQFVPVAVVQQLQTNIAALSARQHAREAEDVIAPALQDGRLLPAEESWARDAAKTPAGLASLSALLQVRQPIAALTGTQTSGKAPDAKSGAHGLNADELAVAAACGMSAEQYAQGKA